MHKASSAMMVIMMPSNARVLAKEAKKMKKSFIYSDNFLQQLSIMPSVLCRLKQLFLIIAIVI